MQMKLRQAKAYMPAFDEKMEESICKENSKTPENIKEKVSTKLIHNKNIVQILMKFLN